MQRVLAIYIPFLSTDRLFARPDRIVDCSRCTSGSIVDCDDKPRASTRKEEGIKGSRDQGIEGTNTSNRQSTIDNRRFASIDNRQFPIATISPHGQTIRIVHVNQSARRGYVRPGQTLAEAKGVVPGLITFPDDPAADRRQLEDLALWCWRFSPIVHIEGQDTLLIDVTGCERLFSGEANLLQKARTQLAGLGFAARGAIADTPGAAWALAHAHEEPAITAETGMTSACLAPLPVWSLRVDEKTTDDLHTVGVETIESLLHLPRSSLTSRFGDRLLDRLDQALGDLPELLTPYRPQPTMTSRLEFGGTTDRFEVLLEAVRQSITSFCEQLNRRTAGVRQLYVTFESPDVPTEKGTLTHRTTLTVSLSQPTRSAGRLFSLVKVKFDGLRLIAPADAAVIWARQVEHLDDCQIEMFDEGIQDRKALSELLDRLIVRLGHESVVRPRLVSDHQPERAFRYEPVINVEKNVETSKRRNAETDQNRDRKGPVLTNDPGIRASREQGNKGSRDKGNKRRHAPPLSIADCRLPVDCDQKPPCNQNRDHEGAAQTFPTSGRFDRTLGGGTNRQSIPMYIGNNRQSSQISNLKSQISDFGPQVSVIRPTWLLAHLLPIAATSIVPDGPPIAFDLHGRRYEAVDCIGPERIETGWWRGAHIRRDYFRVLTNTGRRCWLFRARDTGQWFLHGWFD